MELLVKKKNMNELEKIIQISTEVTVSPCINLYALTNQGRIFVRSDISQKWELVPNPKRKTEIE